MSAYERLSVLFISISQLPPPVATDALFVRTGDHLFLSRHIAKIDGLPFCGQLGVNVATEQGKAAARTVAIDLIAILHAGVGDLDKITRMVKFRKIYRTASSRQRCIRTHH